MLMLRRRILVGLLSALLIGALIAVPTGIIQTSWYHRMTPVLWWNYPVWAVSSVLTGALLATYVRDPTMELPRTQATKTFLGNALTIFAVGCPICNKLVVMAIGVSGALNVFAPIQPLLALSSILLLGYALWARLRTPVACRVELRA